MRNMSYCHINKTPCFECKDRKVTADYNCHSVCEKYLAFNIGRREENRQAAINTATYELYVDRKNHKNT